MRAARKETKANAPLSEIASLHAALLGMPDDIQLTPAKAAEALQVMGVDVGTNMLAKMRCISSKGPTFRKVGNGRVVYRLGDLRRFAGVVL